MYLRNNLGGVYNKPHSFFYRPHLLKLLIIERRFYYGK
nr:MAG TPA: hypothetical protein [Caudoviricetes sp.]